MNGKAVAHGSHSAQHLLRCIDSFYNEELSSAFMAIQYDCRK
jgi:hypothetical protein